MKKVYYILFFTILVITTATVDAKPHDKEITSPDKKNSEISYTLEDRDRMIRLEQDLKNFHEEIDKRFDNVNQRFDDMNKRFDDLKSFMTIITSVFTALVIVVISLAFWDRTTVLRRAKEETTKQVKVIEIEGRLKDLIFALRELAKSDPKVASIMKNFNLL